MKQLQKKDLIKDEIYVDNYDERYNTINLTHLFKATKDLKNCKSIYLKQKENGGIGHHWFNHSLDLVFRKATPEEKHWLNTCIEADKFISYEEAMKTFIPEYIECVKKNSHDFGTNIIGRIYKVLGKTSNNVNADYLIEYDGKKYNSVSQDRFKSSTKEAYDAQFKDNFVLPEQWCVKVTSDNNDFINSVRDRSCTPNTYVTSKLIISNIKNSWLCKMEAPYEGFTEITLEEFKKYVLEEQLEEPKDKVLVSKANDNHNSRILTIVKVQCSEGGVYKIGDKITVFNKTSPNKNKVFTIKGFKWNNAKTNLCAITELHRPNGIGLDKIELYIEPKIEPKQELSLLEQAKLRYPIGTKFKCVNKNDIHSGREFSIVTDYKQFDGEDSNWGVFCSDNGWIVLHNQWAEIVDDFVLPEIW